MNIRFIALWYLSENVYIIYVLLVHFLKAFWFFPLYIHIISTIYIFLLAFGLLIVRYVNMRVRTHAHSNKNFNKYLSVIDPRAFSIYTHNTGMYRYRSRVQRLISSFIPNWVSFECGKEWNKIWLYEWKEIYVLI